MPVVVEGGGTLATRINVDTTLMIGAMEKVKGSLNKSNETHALEWPNFFRVRHSKHVGTQRSG